ncbi:PREDICTED: uncharacterized protein LOC106933083 [Poecilia mexicana]|uniref:uncharacterized protein LOC106933083 n=1 Tax=Poecilia mexicana TaxID=48701 RepID=UPI00072EC124|nr:PREDICTED: uncharacterized protein LOC106933083 [Poecilia mexicana]
MEFSQLERFFRQNIQTQMFIEIPQFFDSILWINIHVCFPFTFLVIGLSIVIQQNGPDHHYMNMLLSNLLQLIVVIVAVTLGEEPGRNYISSLIYGCGVAAALTFRTIVAWKRYSSVSSAQLDSSGNKNCFCVGCIIVWTLFVSVFSFMFAFNMTLYLFILPVFFVPIFIIFLVWIVRSLSAATSVPAEEKCRTVGTLVLWLVNYSVTILTPAIYVVCAHWFNYDREMLYIFLTLSLLSPSLDLVLFVFCL